jgi:hypothetical protein
MNTDYWMIRVKLSSPEQAKTNFGNSAWRPYLTAIIDQIVIVDDDLIRKIVEASFDESVVPNVSYKKHFHLEAWFVSEYQYGRMVYDQSLGKWIENKFYTLKI